MPGDLPGGTPCPIWISLGAVAAGALLGRARGTALVERFRPAKPCALATELDALTKDRARQTAVLDAATAAMHPIAFDEHDVCTDCLSLLGLSLKAQAMALEFAQVDLNAVRDRLVQGYVLAKAVRVRWTRSQETRLEIGDAITMYAPPRR